MFEIKKQFDGARAALTTEAVALHSRVRQRNKKVHGIRKTIALERLSFTEGAALVVPCKREVEKGEGIALSFMATITVYGWG